MFVYLFKLYPNIGFNTEQMDGKVQHILRTDYKEKYTYVLLRLPSCDTQFIIIIQKLDFF